jgi:nucleotide-binding universal stress UspA family protein
MFEKMLVCLDGSDLAEQILPYAREQAKRFGSKIFLLHVVEKPATITAPGEPELVLEEQDRFRLENLEAPAYLESVAEPLHGNGIDTSCVVIEGTVGEAILAYTDQYEIDLIAMATHGRSGLGRAVFGSVADFVLRESGTPILLIKPQETETQLQAEAPAFEKILVCLDGSKLAEQIMPYATEEALRFRSTLVLFQVVPEPIAVSPGVPGAAPVPVQTETMHEEAQKALDEAKDYLEELAMPLRDKSIQVEAVTIPGRAGEAVVSYANSNNLDLIAIATHGRSGLGRAVFGSVADFVLRESGLPLLVIKPQGEES